MHGNRLHQEVIVFRGDRKSSDDDRRGWTGFEGAGQKVGLRHRKWMILVLAFLLTCLLVVNTYTTGQFDRIVRPTGLNNNGGMQENEGRFAEIYKAIITPGYLVYNQGCRIPEMDPLDPAIRGFIHPEKDLICEAGSQAPLVESNGTAVYINLQARDFYYNQSETVDCCWRIFRRTENSDNDVSYDKDCQPFNDSSSVEGAEYVKVECRRNNERIYRDYHAFVPRKDAVEARCNQEKRPPYRPLSVLIVGIDSVSRLNFHRMMPKTAEALKLAGAVEMLGYNKVGDNTYPNLVPVLTGWSAEELSERCWQDRKKTFDDCPFIWKNFSRSGYRTVFAEDACAMTTFNYLKPGFREPPTDYYLRPYCIAAENDIGNTHKLNAHLCLGTRKNYDSLLAYARKVALQFSRDPYFAFVWQASLTHDYFNYPQLGDQSFRNLIDGLIKDDLLSDSALILMSDHGMRWGEFRQTYQGRTEDSLPFVYVLLPDWWKEQHPLAWANLRRNSRSLTTGFDLHETLLDLLEPRNLNEEIVRERVESLSNGQTPRGISWFLPIPDHRSCSMADIPGHWCMCHGSNQVALNDTQLRHSLDYLLGQLNDMLSKFPQCARLKLKSLLDAKMWSGQLEEGQQLDDKDKAAPWIDYTVTLETRPGNAIFEGSVRYRSDDNSRKLIGSVSRLNAYGKQSACVDEFSMRLYCYCLSSSTNKPHPWSMGEASTQTLP